MSFGGMHPYPRRFGGGRPRLRIVHDALCAARGSAVDASNSSTAAWVECMAHARAITFDGYGTNDRVALQADPARTTDMLSRWEKIFGIVSAPTASKVARREVLVRRWKRFIEATAFHSRLLTRLRNEVGEVFSNVEYIGIDNAVVHVPAGGDYPFGTVAYESIGVPAGNAQWTSTVAHILVLLVKPSGYTEVDFYAAAAKVAPALDGLVPAWVTFDWYRAPTGYPAINVSGGPSQAGFYLDAENNLDNVVFDV